jgi:hypothetical protein
MIVRVIHIDHANIFTDVEMLSSMAGREAYDGNGESLYDTVHITDQDRDFVDNAIDDCAQIIRAMCSEYVCDYSDKEIKVNMPEEFTDGIFATFIHSVNDTIKNYVFFKWLEHAGLPEIAAKYQEVYNMCLEATKSAFYARMKPVPRLLKNKEVRMIIKREDIEFMVKAATNKLWATKEGQGTDGALNQLRFESTPENIGLLSAYIGKYDGVVRGRLDAYLKERRANRGHTDPHFEPYYYASHPAFVPPHGPHPGPEHHHHHHGPHPSGGVLEVSSHIRAEGDLIYELTFPVNWDDSTLEKLVASTTDYIANMCIYEFLKVSAPSESMIYKQIADGSYVDIKTCLTARENLQSRPHINFDML